MRTTRTLIAATATLTLAACSTTPQDMTADQCAGVMSRPFSPETGAGLANLGAEIGNERLSNQRAWCVEHHAEFRNMPVPTIPAPAVVVVPSN